MGLNTKLLLLVLVVLFALGCHKNVEIPVERPYSNPGYTHCGEILDGWQISTIELPDEVPTLVDIFFANENTGWTVGAHGSITKTIDGGKTWTILNDWHSQPLLTGLNLQCIDFVNENIGFIGGVKETFGTGPEQYKGAVFLKTTDGGLHWSKKYFINFYEFFDIKFYNATDGIALIRMEDQNGNDYNVLVKTKDGGDSWSPVATPFKGILSHKIAEAGTSIFLTFYADNGNFYLLSSNDRGISWEIKNTPTEIDRLDFINDKIGYASSYLSFKTTNGGQSWEVLDSPYNVESLMHFKNPDEGFIINPSYYSYTSGGEGYIDYKSFEVFQTKDGGKNWSKNVTYVECDFTGYTFTLNGDVFYTFKYGKINKFKAK